MLKVSILTCALVMHSVGLWLQGSGCVEEQLFHMREINAILRLCEVQMALVLLRSRMSQSVPHAKSHTIDRYISNIRHYLTDPSRFHPTQSALIMTDPTLRPAPITVEATDRTRIKRPSHGHGDVEAP